ncbi:MAG: hypothetical protein ACI31M_01615 [Bacilli bacterium]
MNSNLRDSKISYLDAAFLGTSESQGFKNAKTAIKLCLFNDMSVLKDNNIDYSKWLLISSKYDGRRKAKMLQQDDLAHILIKYCMASFALRDVKFSVNESIYMEHRQNPRISTNLTRKGAVELVAYAAFKDLYSAYVFLFSNLNVCNLVVDSLIEERYLNMQLDIFDNFNGYIISPEVENEFKYMYFMKYRKLDEEFATIKNENDNYIK